MAEFLWAESHGSPLTERPNVAVVKYGNGYESRVGLGIRTIFQVWKLTFEDVDIEIGKDILNFLRARGGVESFTWQNCLGETLKVVCREWEFNPKDNFGATLTATFEEVPG